MKIIADLHIHSGYARACSKELTLRNIEVWAKKKGINIISVADFTHPQRLKEIKQDLEEVGKSGLYKIKKSNSGVLFVLSTELSLIYRDKDKTRRIHMCVFLSSLEKVDKFNKELEQRGAKLKSDGRPIIGMSSKEVLQIVMSIDKKGFIVPAHIWTPWFAMFGSKSGYDSLEECFEELTSEVKAVETGLSSSPAMNRRLSMLDGINLLSSSDSHSLPNIGRNATLFDLDKLTYDELRNAINTPKSKKIVKTLEFYPEEGIYHYDGHRKCNTSFTPKETKKHKGICPKCKKPLTLGVMYRVEELADRDEKDIHSLYNCTNFIPLQDIIADVLSVGKQSKKVQSMYEEIIKFGKDEFNVLLNLSKDELLKICDSGIVEAIMRVRKGKVKLTPGFDGQYGKIEIFTKDELEVQKSLL
ncbi:MAG: endonuclease Q family protein [Candidatus Komeilibacteria bacterium]